MPLAGATPVLFPAIGRYWRVWQCALRKGSGFNPLYLGLAIALGEISQYPLGTFHETPTPHGPKESTHRQHRHVEPRLRRGARDRLGGGLDFRRRSAIWKSSRVPPS
jgi:hypothetical protein